MVNCFEEAGLSSSPLASVVVKYSLPKFTLLMLTLSLQERMLTARATLLARRPRILLTPEAAALPAAALTLAVVAHPVAVLPAVAVIRAQTLMAVATMSRSRALRGS